MEMMGTTGTCRTVRCYQSNRFTELLTPYARNIRFAALAFGIFVEQRESSVIATAWAHAALKFLLIAVATKSARLIYAMYLFPEALALIALLLRQIDRLHL